MQPDMTAITWSVITALTLTTLALGAVVVALWRLVGAHATIALASAIRRRVDTVCGTEDEPIPFELTTPRPEPGMGDLLKLVEQAKAEERERVS